MPVVKFKSQSYERKQYESVLDCLLRHQQHIPYACKAGMCQACLVKALDCEATEESRKWIKPTLQAKGYTLACQWVPEGDVALGLPLIEEFSVPVVIKALTALNPRVLKVALEVEDRSLMFHYVPGQYLTLINPAGIARSYSIANSYEQDGFIELHISRTTKGVFTGWLFEDARPGDELHMRGPAGDCFYTQQESEDFPLLLAGTGTGLAPLYGVARDALDKGHPGTIHLYHGGRTTEHLYYIEELQELAAQNSHFTYIPCVMEPGPGAQTVFTGTVEQAIEAYFRENLARTRVFLCGAPDFVHGLRKQIFLKGVRSSHIHCDPFIERTVNSEQASSARQ